MTTSSTPPGLVDITIDGAAVRVPSGTTVFDAARMNGVSIPTLCHLQNETPVGVCRLCLVDTGARVLAASCVRPVEPGMKVLTNSDKVLSARKTLLELLMADHPSPCARQTNSGDCELETLAQAAGIKEPRAGMMILPFPLQWITMHAFFATAAFAAAMRCAQILFWGAWAKAIPRASRLT